MEPESSRWAAGRDGICMKLEGQISMGASIYGLAQAAVCTWRSENSFLELLLSSHYVEPGD